MKNINYAWQTQKAGKISNLKLLKKELQELDSKLIRVKVKAIGLNFADIFALTGLYSATPEGEFIPGLEFSGVVHYRGFVGNSIKGCEFLLGQKVMGVTRFSAYQQYIDIKQEYIKPLPENWTFQQGAAFFCTTLTAFYALKILAQPQQNEVVLIHSAAGGVGLQALKIAQKLNLQLIGTVGNQNKKEFLEKQAYTSILVRNSNFQQQLQNLLKEKYNSQLDIVLDAIGGNVQKDSFKLLSPMGRLIVFGAAVFTPNKDSINIWRSIKEYLFRPRYDPLEMTSKNKSLLCFNLIWLWEKTDLFTQMIDDIYKLNLEPPYVGHQYNFADLKQGIEKLRSGTSNGKVIINIIEQQDNNPKL